MGRRKKKKLDMQCGFCNKNHAMPGTLCGGCCCCYDLCVGSEICTLGKKMQASKPIVTNTTKEEIKKDVSTPVQEEIDKEKRDFLVWLASSACIVKDCPLTSEQLWLEFLEIKNEVLEPVDLNKFYGLMLLQNNGLWELKKVDKENLYKNKNNDYIYFDKFKRKNFGKSIVVFEFDFVDNRVDGTQLSLNTPDRSKKNGRTDATHTLGKSK